MGEGVTVCRNLLWRDPNVLLAGWKASLRDTKVADESALIALHSLWKGKLKTKRKAPQRDTALDKKVQSGQQRQKVALIPLTNCTFWLLKLTKMLHFGGIQVKEVDPRRWLPFSCHAVGLSSYGKTYFERNVLEKCEYGMDLVAGNTGLILVFNPCVERQKKKTKLPDSFKDEQLFLSVKTHLVILNGAIFRVTDHPDENHDTHDGEYFSLR